MHTLVFLVHVAVGLISSSGYQILSQNKETQQAKEVPRCQETGTCQQFQSSRAVDGNINTCTRTAPFGSNVLAQEILSWWYVDLEKVLSIYSIRIQFKDYGEQYVMRRFAGFSLYVSNTTIKEDGYLCYKNGQELPNLDVSTTCVKHGRYVIFYNERLDGTTYPSGYETFQVYTELCEVTVTGCEESGVYGYNCDLPCPNNCQEMRCDIVNGTCLGCTAGWVGGFCNKSCPAVYYGLQCGSTCTGHSRDNLSCNHITGQCDYGCGNGWTGIHCNTQCPSESYGPDCVYKCSGQCLSYLPCNRTTGRCDGSCNSGYIGELCDKVCSVGRYGLNCSESCSSHCRSESNHCNHKDGHCEHGCDDGFQGSTCEEICDDSWYGENCSARCNENCVNQSCDHITGSCKYGCKPGWRTPHCKQECSVGTYDNDCENYCSSHCRNMTCNPITGSCLEGCTPGYLGSSCNKACDKETYGINCSQNCSQNCLGECDNVDGSCTCSSGWTGSPGCSEKAPIVSNDEYSSPDAYIAALSISLVINFSLVVVIVILLRQLYNRKQEKRSLDYITGVEISLPPQISNNDVHQYQELNMRNDSSYQNLSLRDRL